MKILFIGRYNESSLLTGPEKVANRIFNKSPADFETMFITYFFDGNKHSLFTKLFGKEIIKETINSRIYRLGIIRALQYMFKFNPDIIHIITYERFGRISFLYKIFSKTNIFYNVHGIAAFENSVNPLASAKLKSKDYICEKQYLTKSDRLIFLSERSVVTAGKYFEIDKSKIEIIPNGIDEIFHQIGKTKENNFNNALRIVFVGDSDKREKGFEFLCDSLEKIEFRAEVFILGSYYKANKKRNTNINFTFIERMETEVFAKFLYDKDIFISASSYEQFSMTSVEAMAAGLVPVVTEETGMSSYIENGINGFVVKYGDTGELVKVLNKLEADRNHIMHISAEAKKIYSRLSWDLVYRKYKALYE